MSDFDSWTRHWLIGFTGAAVLVIGIAAVRGERDPRKRADEAAGFNHESYDRALDEAALRPVSLDFVELDRAAVPAPDGSLIGLANGQRLVDYTSYRRWGQRDVEYVRDAKNVIWRVHRSEHAAWSESYEVDEQCSLGGSGAFDGDVWGGFALPPNTSYGGDRTIDYATHDVEIVCLGGYISPA